MISYRDCAVVYVAWNQRAAEESLVSARSVRRAMPDIAIYLKIGGSLASVTGKRWSVFNRVAYVRDMQQTFIDKYYFLSGVAEGKVLCLDSDTRVLSGLREAFDLLERFEVACAHAPFRFTDDFGPHDPRLPPIPAAFPELNAGVIFCRNTAKVRRMLRTCRKMHAGWAYEDEHTSDQPALRCALWKSRVSLYVLPPEYNARLCFPAFLSGEAKILHCRLDNPRTAVRIINASLEPRTFQPQEFGE
jgi:hypothetical protein